MYKQELQTAIDGLWIAAGREPGTLARVFSFPVNSAGSVAKAFSTLSILFMGPEINNGDVMAKKDYTMIIIFKSCPMVSRARTYGIGERTVFPSCRALLKLPSAVSIR